MGKSLDGVGLSALIETIYFESSLSTFDNKFTPQVDFFFNYTDTPNPWPKHRCLGQALGVSVQLKKFQNVVYFQK